MNPKVITICANKGGVGKSTLAAAIMANIPRQTPTGWTLGLSMDSQDNLCDILRVDVYSQYPTIAEQLMSDGSGLRGVEIAPHTYYIPSGLDIELMAQRGYDIAAAMADKIAHANDTSYYDYIIIDCPPALNTLTRAAVAVSDYVIIPMQPVPLDVRGTCATIEYVNAISSSQGRPSKVLGIPFLLDDHYRVNEEVKQLMEETFPGLPFRQTVRRTIRMEEAIMGRTLLSPVPRNYAALDYANLTKEILDRIKDK